MRILLFFVASLLSIVFACTSSKKESKRKADDSLAFAEAERSLQNEVVRGLVYNTPLLTEVPYLLESTGADFNQSLLLDINKEDFFMDKPDYAALALGAYSSDVAYLSSYQKTQEAIKYLQFLKKLADHLNIVGSFDVDMLKRFERNADNRDSLAALINKAIEFSSRSMRQGTKDRTFALILTGGFIESLALSANIINSFPKNLLKEEQRGIILAPIVNVILKQSSSTDEIVKMLISVDAAEPVRSLLAEVKELQAIYAKIHAENQLLQEKDATKILANKNLSDIIAQANKLRNKFKN